MEHNWCRECGRVGHTVMHFMPPPACTKPAVSVCWDCARSDARYYWWYKTYAEKEFFLDDDDLSALRVWVTASPLNRGYAQSRLYLEVDLQEAYDAKYPAAAGPVGHFAHNAWPAAQHAAQHLAAAAPEDEADRRGHLRNYVDAMQDVTPEIKSLMLETEGAMRYYTHGHGRAYLENIADGAQVEAVRLLSMAAPVVRFVGSGDDEDDGIDADYL